MTTSERPTPMTDKVMFNTFASTTAIKRLANHARRLERVAGALAERLESHTDMLCVCGENDCHKDKAALAEWNKMKEELT